MASPFTWMIMSEKGEADGSYPPHKMHPKDMIARLQQLMRESEDSGHDSIIIEVQENMGMGELLVTSWKRGD